MDAVDVPRPFAAVTARRWKTVVMLRVKNEARWIRRCLESVWPVSAHVLLFDDHSTDQTLSEAARSLTPEPIVPPESGAYVVKAPRGQLSVYRSVFTGLDEVRDKNFLWLQAAATGPEFVLALDGDEQLSRCALRNWDKVLDRLEGPEGPGAQMPFVYLWDREDRQRVDGVYADIWHPRLFCTKHLPRYAELRFHSHGTPGGLHCGSVPAGVQAGFRAAELPIIHFGYLPAELREEKFRFYSEADPGNKAEGEYRHIVGLPNHIAPGPVTCREFQDT